jgi:hypothetical protein
MIQKDITLYHYVKVDYKIPHNYVIEKNRRPLMNPLNSENTHYIKLIWILHIH